MRRSCKKFYNKKAVEFWFAQLDLNWEKSFTMQELHLGRNIYRRRQICAIELTTKEAIIHSEKNQKPTYAVVECIDQKLNIRLSTKDQQWGNSLAAAGIYEIEELIAENIDPIPEDKPSHTSKTYPKDLSSKDSTPVSSPIRVPSKPILFLELHLTRLGLTLQTFYRKKNKKVKVPLHYFSDKKAQWDKQEREQLIRLTSFIRKAGFVYHLQEKAYYLSNPAGITYFLKNHLPEWRRYFKIKTFSSLEKLHAGIKEVRVEANLISKQNQFQLDWHFKLGDKELSSEQKKILLKHGQSVVFFPEIGMVKMRSDQVQDITTWQEQEKANTDSCLPYYLIFSLFNYKNITVLLSQELQQWHASFAQKAFSTLPVPDFLRTYQAQGVKWLAHFCEHNCHPLLADEMGLGKTVQILALIAARPLSSQSHLIVCPASVIPVWKAEAQKFFPELKLASLSKETYPGSQSSTHSKIWLTSYSQLRRQRAKLNKIHFGYVILDEAQAIKNPEAKTTLACLSLSASHRIALTGTPVENTPLDLWTIFRFLMPGLLGNRLSFQKNLQDNPIETIDRLHQQIRPFVLRRTKQAVATELPSKVVIDVKCPLTELQQRVYQKIVEEGLQDFGNDLQTILQKKRINFFSLLMRLRQTSCDPGLLPWLKVSLKQSGKLKCLWPYLAEIFLNNGKVVIFSQFVSYLERVQKGIHHQFPAIPCFMLTGKTRDRASPVDHFQKTKEAAVILVSLKAGGTGITLNTAEYAFLLDPWWNPAVEEQAIDRIHRIGQKKRVFIYRLIAEGTIEERIAQLQSEKHTLFRKLIGTLSGKAKITDHYSSLKELITLKEKLP